MLKYRTFALLVGFSVLLVFAIMFQPTTTIATATAKQRVFPRLLDKLDQVQSIAITTHTHSFELAKRQSQWAIVNASEQNGSEPRVVAVEKVKELLFAVADLIQVEAKTANPDLYSRIEVEDLQQQAAKGAEIRLLDKHGDALAALLVGKVRPAKANYKLHEYFVRKSGDKQAWLVVGDLPAFREKLAWLDLDKQAADLPAAAE